MRRLITVMVAAGILLAFSAAPTFAQYPPDDDAVVVSDTTVVPGETLTVAGEGWLPGSDVTMVLFADFSEPQLLGTARVGDDGSFSTQVTIPEDAEPGEHTLRVSGTDEDGQPRTDDVTLVVLSPGAVAPDEARLAATGSSSLAGLGAALALFVVGGGALYAARRRQNGGRI